MRNVAIGVLLAVVGAVALGVARHPRAAAAGPPHRPAPAPPAFTITSSAFANGARIPARYTADGANVSPPLAWKHAPRGTKSFALIMDDPDAPRGTFTHWVLYDLPATQSSLPTAVPASAVLPKLGRAKQGVNDTGGVGYFGPAPPAGKVHHYRFTLYALRNATGLPARATRARVEKALKPLRLGQTRVTGAYSR